MWSSFILPPNIYQFGIDTPVQFQTQQDWNKKLSKQTSLSSPPAMANIIMIAVGWG